MSPVLVALGAMACYFVALCGWALLRDQATEAQFLGDQGVLPRQERRQSVVERALAALSQRLSGYATELLGPAQIERARRRLARAGYPDGMTVASYAGRKAAWALLGIVVGALLALNGQLVLAVFMSIAGWFLIDIGLNQEGNRRQAGITRTLPDFLDILAVTISAGSSFRNALYRVAEELPGALSSEIMTALRQMELGASRREAFEDLRTRNDADTLNAFVTSLLQAEELGAPLSETLEGIARDMRTERGQRARKQASRAAPKISLIVTVIMVPGALILVFAAMIFGTDFNLDMFDGF